MSEVIKRLVDPSLKWYVSKLLGTRVYGNVSGTNQTLYVCDDLICIPTRFSEYFKWWDKTNNTPGNRMFDKEEAWDHVNESNPTTAYPRDSDGKFLAGYNSYLIIADLTDGTNRVCIHIVRKYKQLLIYNLGFYIQGGTKYTVNIPVKVYFPPASLGLVYQTNGNVGSDGITIASGQYVLFYPSDQQPEQIDTQKKIFMYSPMGSNKVKTYEIKTNNFILGKAEIPELYLGIRTNEGQETIPTVPIIYAFNNISSIYRAPINASGFEMGIINFVPYTNDPYATAGTWMGSNHYFTLYVGWAEDLETGKVKYILLSSIAYKHNTKRELFGDTSASIIYDAENREQYILGMIKPATNFYSYGRVGVVPNPFLFLLHNRWIYETLYGDATKAVLVKYDDTIDVKTTDATTCYEWNDGYGFCNIYSNFAICFEYLAFYTDDTGITISNPKNMGLNRCDAFGIKRGIATDQVKPFMDRTLYAGKTYFAMARVWSEPPNLSDAEYGNRIKKYTPKVLSSDEWSNLVTNLPPYSLNIRGIPPTATDIIYTYTKQVNPGQQVTLSGYVSGLEGVHAFKKVKLILLDQSNNIVYQSQTYTDESGNFSFIFNAPQNTGTYKVVIIATNESQPAG